MVAPLTSRVLFSVVSPSTVRVPDRFVALPLVTSKVLFRVVAPSTSSIPERLDSEALLTNKSLFKLVIPSIVTPPSKRLFPETNRSPEAIMSL